MNQIEIWFSILARKLLKRASFISTEDLKGRLLAFVEYFNETMAKPFKTLSSKRGFPEQRRSFENRGALILNLPVGNQTTPGEMPGVRIPVLLRPRSKSQD